MPYRTSSPESLAHAQLVVDALGIKALTVDISTAVDGLAAAVHDPPTPGRLGNIMARTRMITLFDLSAAHVALPLGTGNKTERLFGYFTWHGDDTPPVNPIGDLFKTQVIALARHLGLPDVIVEKPASADLITGQTDEGDFGSATPVRMRSCTGYCSGTGDPNRGPRIYRGGDRAGAEAVGLNALEAAAADGRDAQRYGHRGVLPAAVDIRRRGEPDRCVIVPFSLSPDRLRCPRITPHVPTRSATSPPSSCRTCRTSAATCSAAS